MKAYLHLKKMVRRIKEEELLKINGLVTEEVERRTHNDYQNKPSTGKHGTF